MKVSLPSPRLLSKLCLILFTATLGLWNLSSHAHPIPDIPVRGVFENGGKAKISVEINPRCFDEDPDTATALIKALYETLAEARTSELISKATDLVRKNLELYFEPIGRIQPEFHFEFTGEGRKTLEDGESVVVLTGEWETQIPAGVTGWSVRSAPSNKVSVVFQNTVNGTAHPRVAVLFPGERSFTLDLTQLTGAVPTQAQAGSIPAEGGSGHSASTFWSFLKQGFWHVLPEGLDHILFVLGLFFLQRALKPILLQVTTFTLAHSVTLALATLGKISAPGKIVEPLIAASITLVALENILKPQYSHRSLVVVFVFGLVHDLGFASALGDLSIPKGSEILALAGFNVGVEGGQLAVIALALAATAWVRNPDTYRRWVVIPASTAIGVCGLFWVVQRIGG